MKSEQMTNFQFLVKYQQLQQGIMFDKIIDLGFATVGYCRGDSSAFWNYALVDRKATDKELLAIEEKLESLNRASTLYFENRRNLSSLVKQLLSKGYKREFEDSWMFYKGSRVRTAGLSRCRKVKTRDELDVFIKTLDACYQKDDPQNAYGELGDYLDVSREVWYRHQAADKVEYFTVFKEERPVAVSTLTNFGGIGYISNVGSLREVRGEGYGKLATFYCVNRSVENGNSVHCLATEEGTYANEFYKRIGFETRFTALGIKKKIS